MKVDPDKLREDDAAAPPPRETSHEDLVCRPVKLFLRKCDKLAGLFRFTYLWVWSALEKQGFDVNAV